MSSNCPPQLHLSIQPSTTTFKRSFEQFGFDLESPVGATDAGGSGTNNGNDRSKRARSSSSFSESSDSTEGSGSSTMASRSESSSSSISPSRNEPAGSGGIASDLVSRPIVRFAPELSTRTSLEPPRLPTPMLQDIEMSDYAHGAEDNDELASNLASAAPSQAQQQSNEDRYRLSLERFNAFESEISVLRRSRPPSPLVGRSPTAPPTLPPLSISTNRARQSPSDMAFFHPSPRPTTPLFAEETFFPLESPSSTRVQSPTTIRDNSVHDEQGQEQETPDEAPFPHAHFPFRGPFALPLSLSGPRMDHHRPASSSRQPDFGRRTDDEVEMVNGFRERLNSALERLRPASPLVPGLGDGDHAGESDQSRENGSLEDDEEEEGEEEDEEEEEDEDDEEEDNISSPTTSTQNQNLAPNPPTLPPIPPITADAEDDDWTDPVSFLSENIMVSPTIDSGPSHRTSPSVENWHDFRSRLQNPSLRDHPLPSPILRDLHSWMDEHQPVASSSSNESRGNSSSNSASVPDPGTSGSADTSLHQQQQQHTTPAASHPHRGAEWAFYDSMFAPFSASSSSTTTTAPASAFPSSSHSAAAPGSSGAGATSNTSTSGSSSSLSASSSDLFANPISASYSRNVADEAAVRSLDHGIGMGLGFGSGSYRPARRPLSALYPGVEGHGHGQGMAGTGAMGSGSGAAGAGASGVNSRVFQHFGSGSPSSLLWRYSHTQQQEENGNENVPDLNLDFGSLAGNPGSSSSSSSSQQEQAEAPGNSFSSFSFDSLFGPPAASSASATVAEPSPDSYHHWLISEANNTTTTTSSTTRTSPQPAGELGSDSASSTRPSQSGLPGGLYWPWTRQADTPNSELAPSASTSTAVQHRDETQPPFFRQRLRSVPTSARPGSSTSLVAENAAEVRRRADYAELERSRRMLADSRASETESASRGLTDSSGGGSSSSRGRNGSFGGRTHTLEEFLHDRLRTLPGGAEVLEGSGMRGYRPIDQDASTSTSRDSVLDSSILGRRGRWGLPMPATTTTMTSDGGTSGDVDMFGSRDFSGGGPLSLHLPAIVSPAGAEGSGTIRTSMDSTTPQAPITWYSLPEPPTQDSSRTETTATSSSSAASFPNPSPFSSRSTPPTSSNERQEPSMYSSFADMMEGVVETNFASNNNNDQTGVSSTSGSTYRSEVPSLPPPDLGGTFDAERHAQGIASASTTTSSLQQDDRRNDVPPQPTPRSRDSTDMDFNSMLTFGRRPSLSGTPLYDSRTAVTEPILARENRIAERTMLEQQRRRLVEESARAQAREVVNARLDARATRPSDVQVPSSSAWSSAVSQDRPTPEVRWLPGEYTMEERLQGRSRPTTSVLSDRGRQYNPPSMDPETFTPGPFRNTIQHLTNAQRMRSTMHPLPPAPPPSEPPTIPPLSFGDNLASLRDRVSRASAEGSHHLHHHHQHQHQDSSSSSGSNSHQPSLSRDLPPRRDILRPPAAPPGAMRPVADGPQNPALQPRVFPRSFASARAASQLTNAMNNENSNRAGLAGGRSDVHSQMTRRLRMEASRLDDSDGPGSGQGPVQGQGRASLDPLRPDGLNTARQRQLIQQYHHHHHHHHHTRDSGPGSDGPAPHPPHLPHARYAPPAAGRRPRFAGLMDPEGWTSNTMSSSTESSTSTSTRRPEPETDDEMPASMLRAHRGRFSRSTAELAFMFGGRGPRRGRPLGDFMRDEDFDESYEGLLNLAQTLGDAKPRSTPTDIIEKMEKAQYKDWATAESDQRCPICLDDYGPTDSVLKLPNCSHWLHQDCVRQWLTTANTCPVCRKTVNTNSSSSSSGFRSRAFRPHHHPHPMRLQSNHHPMPPRSQQQQQPPPQQQPSLLRGWTTFRRGSLHGLASPATGTGPSSNNGTAGTEQPGQDQAADASTSNNNTNSHSRNPSNGNPSHSPFGDSFGAPWRR